MSREIKPVIMRLTTTLTEEVDAVMYGKFYSHTRETPPVKGPPFVQMKQGGPWIEVVDWKKAGIPPHKIKELAEHFIELGKKMV